MSLSQHTVNMFFGNDSDPLYSCLPCVCALLCLAITRLALLSQLYTTNKQKMTKQEKREVLEYVQARVVVCLDHGKELLELVLAKWDGLSLDQKQEAAAYIIPEVIPTCIYCHRYSQQVIIL